MASLSFCAVVYNEVDTIEATIEQVRPLVDEVLCWDQSSDDGTSEKLAKIADQHIRVPYKGDVYLDEASFHKVAESDWILSVGSGEQLSTRLYDFVRQWKESQIPNVSTFWAPRRTTVDGKSIAKILDKDHQIFLWQRLGPDRQPAVIFKNVAGLPEVEVRSPFQAWLSDDRHIVSNQNLENLVRRHMRFRHGHRRLGSTPPLVQREAEFIVKVAGLLKTDLPEYFFRPEEGTF
jgi:hypothetical protein